MTVFESIYHNDFKTKPPVKGTWRFKIPNYILRGITLETVPDTEIAFPLSSRLANPQFPFFFPGHEPSIIPQCQNKIGPKN